MKKYLTTKFLMENKIKVGLGILFTIIISIMIFSDDEPEKSAPKPVPKPAPKPPPKPEPEPELEPEPEPEAEQQTETVSTANDNTDFVIGGSSEMTVPDYEARSGGGEGSYAGYYNIMDRGTGSSSSGSSDTEDDEEDEDETEEYDIEDLYEAVLDNDEDLVEELLDADVDPDELASTGFAPLHRLSIASGGKDLAIILLNNTDVDVLDSNERTPISHAAENARFYSSITY